MTLKDFFSKRWVKRTLKISGLVFAGLAVLCLILFYIGKPEKNITWGITFSSIRAEELGFNPQVLLSTMLDDLHPGKVRIPAYWSRLEPKQGEFNFTEIETLLGEANKRGTQVVVVLGKKQPRWPECHQPEWFNALDTESQEAALLNMLEKTVMRLKQHQSLVAWQIENEPYFPYGPNCPPIESELYEKEVALVSQLDGHPIIATDSGEKSAWVPAASSGVNTLGVTMYREVYHDKKGKYITYPLPWWTYNVKAGIVRLLTNADDIIGAELQAEPWLIISNPNETAPAEQLAHMNVDIFNDNIAYAKKVGLPDNYLWGAEWWYWMQREHGDSSVLNAAKDLFNKK